jgi:hypothetical protein
MMASGKLNPQLLSPQTKVLDRKLAGTNNQWAINVQNPGI